MMKYRPLLSTLCLCLLAAISRPAGAQVSAKTQVSDEFVRSAMAFLGYTQVLESDDPYVLAATLLDTALELNPANQQAWALRVELAQAAGDNEAYERALAGYLDTGVKDDRARLNLIRYRLSKNDTLDAQLNSLETLLNSEAGRALSDPLRSRVAGQASAIAAELLDTRAHRRWAVEAARRDPANAEAASVMRDLVIELGGDNVRIGTATVNLIRANPLDPTPRIDLASLLAQEAAFGRAAQQYTVVGTRLSRQPMPIPAYLNWAQCLAMTGEDATVLKLVDEIQALLDALASQAQQGGGADGEAAAPQAEPAGEPAPLPLHFELIRLAVLDGEDDKDAAQAVFDRITERVKSDADELAAQQEGADEQSAVRPESSLALIAAAFGPDLEQAEEFAAALEADDPAQAVARGWIALRQGDAAKAEPLLRPHAGEHKLADAGLAMILGQDDAGRARLLSAVIQQSPGSMASLAAGRALDKLDEKPRPTATGKTLTDLMGKYPESFWLVDIERTPWMEVRFKIDPVRIKPMQPIQGEVTVWNTSRFALAVGEQGPIRQQAMVLISSSSAGVPTPPNPPMVIDLGRRFSLAAGERMTFDVRLDYHRFGLLRANNPGLPLSFDARLLVNPVMTPRGNWLAGGVGGVSEVRNCLVQSAVAKPQDIDRWVTEVGSDDTATRLNALGRLAALNRIATPELVGPAVVDRIRPVMLDAWRDGTDAERAWIIMNTRELEKETTTYPDLFALATESDSKLVWLAMLARQVNDGESDVLRQAVGRQDLPDVSRFAERQRRAIREFEAYAERQREIEEQRRLLEEPG